MDWSKLIGPLLGGVSGIWLYLAAGVVGAGVGGYAMHEFDQIAVSRLEAVVAADKVAIAEYQLAVERDRADANAKTTTQLKGLASSLDAIGEKLSTDEAMIGSQTDMLTKGLRDAPKENACVLSPAVMQYLDGVRKLQQVAPVRIGP